MNDTTDRGSTAAAGFDRAAQLLARYPAISTAELGDLKHWYRKDASAYDVASLASRDDIASGYRAFRADHVDRFGGRELALIGVMLGVVAGGVALMAF